MTRTTNEAVLKLLNPAQISRLRQIELQIGGEGEPILFVRHEIIADLKLSPAQQEKCRLLKEERRKDMITLFLTGESTEALARRLKAHKKETHQRLANVLDADQQAKLREMIGPLFQGEVGPARRPLSPPRPLVGFVRPVTLRYLTLKPVQDELKMTEDQIKKVPELTATLADLLKDRDSWSDEDAPKKLEEAREAWTRRLPGSLMQSNSPAFDKSNCSSSIGVDFPFSCGWAGWKRTLN